ncbi:Myb domain-containing protein [Dioscorea alata]|uniref:Myb domain-containing protein n=1 Tax=Dioscorea alata TaxID=55571 RepID=A0ACB7VP11_DIOAL|nr:Myb domain-containing protein [Dioscorea alata]
MLILFTFMMQGVKDEFNVGSGAIVKKGPWNAEEDEILMEYVSRNGPRDWSSIRYKGLLPRTGKSCRLRWVM